MTRRFTHVAAVLALSCATHACDRGSSGTPTAVTARSADVVRTTADASAAPVVALATSDAGTALAAAAPSGARAVYQGRAEGRGVDAPIHEFYARITADPWTGSGTVRLDVPDADGAVTGSVAFSALTFEGHGFRTGNHVRVTLEQSVPPRENGGPPPEDVFRGTIDAEITANAIRGTWEASAEAGVKRRRGTIEAQRQ